MTSGNCGISTRRYSEMGHRTAFGTDRLGLPDNREPERKLRALMAHAKPEDLKDISSLLIAVRELALLKEKSPGCFYYKGKGILHFHVQQGRRFAHAFDGSAWQEIDLPNQPSLTWQKNYFKAIRQLLPIPKSTGHQIR